MFHCILCGKEFIPYRNHERYKYCKGCAKTVTKKRSSNHSVRVRQSRGRWLDLYKIKKGCEFCGYNENPLALQWDHIEPNTKSATIGTLVSASLKKLFEELRKCRVLCANCHAIHTYSERHSWRNSESFSNDEMTNSFKVFDSSLV